MVSPMVATMTTDEGAEAAVVREVAVAVEEGAAARALVPSDASLGDTWQLTGFNDAGWQSGPFGFGYENNPADYQSLIRTRIRPQDVNGSATTFMVRIPFEITDPAELDRLVLRESLLVSLLHVERLGSRDDAEDVGRELLLELADRALLGGDEAERLVTARELGRLVGSGEAE